MCTVHLAEQRNDPKCHVSGMMDQLRDEHPSLCFIVADDVYISILNTLDVL